MSSYDADIAILILERILKFSEFVQPVKIYKGPKLMEGIIVGFGSIIQVNSEDNDTYEKNDISEKHTAEKILRWTRMNEPVSQADCIGNQWIFADLISERTFCAIGNKTGPNIGDSGKL